MDCDNLVIHNHRAAALAWKSAEAVADLKLRSINFIDSILLSDAVLIQLNCSSMFILVIEWLVIIHVGSGETINLQHCLLVVSHQALLAGQGQGQVGLKIDRPFEFHDCKVKSQLFLWQAGLVLFRKFPTFILNLVVFFCYSIRSDVNLKS